MNTAGASAGIRAWQVCLLFFIVLLFPPPLFSQAIRMQTAPRMLIPLADGDIYGVGAGASLTFDIDLYGFLAPWAGLHLQSIPPAASELDGSLFLTSLGGGLGYFTFPAPRLKVGASAGGGIYIGSYRSGSTTLPTGNLFWQLGVDAGYRFSPSLTLSGGAAYVDFRRETDSLYRGMAVSILVDIGFRTKGAQGKAVVEEAGSVPVFPITARNYRTDGFGSVTVRNAESAEIRNVEVWFEAEGYTSSAELCGKIDLLPRNATATFPILAGFSDQVMTVTERQRVTGAFRITYELLGESRSSRGETTISILNRNAFTWRDPAVLASFITPNDRALLDLSKHVAGLVRSETLTELDSGLQYALALFEGLRLSGIAWSADPQTPYSRLRQSPGELDYVQYPHQTIAYRGGDSDDLAVLYAAAVESVGVPAAVMPMDGDVLVAVRLESGEAAARSFFSDPDTFLYINGEAWVPVRVSMIREGFLRAWSEGAAMAAGVPEDERRFFRLSEAWKNFPPASVPDIRVTAGKPDDEQVVRAFRNLVSLVVKREVEPKVQRMRESFGGGGSGRQRNALGVLYARYGVYDSALEEFKAAAGGGYERAHINIGNIAFLIGDYQTALSWYEKVYEAYPEETSALIGLARTCYELDRYDEADFYFRKAAEKRPELAERYSYLAARVTGSSVRASAAMERLGDMLWDE